MTRAPDERTGDLGESWGEVDPVAALVPVERARYEVLGEFARGGLGRIFRARDRRTGRVVAIKEVLLAEPAVLRRFAREALVTANLQHPSIVPVYEVGRWPDGAPFFAMMLVNGRALDDLIAETPDPAARLGLLPHAIAVAEALAYAHGERVIHRDLKPANVLVGSFGETVVIDWGLARNLASDEPDAASRPMPVPAAGDQTVAGSVMGTPAYMPPEQARGEVVDERADVYAIGAMLYHLLSGARPYAETVRAEYVLQRVIAGPPRPLTELAPEVPPELVAVVARAMAPTPADRYPTARGLADDLRRFTAGQLVGAHRYTARELVARWVRRNRALVATAAAALVGLGAFGAYSVRRIAAERDEATRQRGAAVRARALAERELGVGLEEFGRQALVAGNAAQAMTYLAASWGHRPEGEPALRFLAGQARNATEAVVAVAPGHAGPTLWAARTPDGSLLLSTGFDRVLRAWDLRARRVRWSHPGPVYAGLSPDGARVASVDEQGALSVYATADGSTVQRATFAAGEETLAIDWSADGARLAVGGRAGTVGLWGAGLRAAGAVRSAAHAGRIRDVRFSPDGALLASAGDDGAVLVWDAATGQPRARLTAHRGQVNSVAWLDATRVVSGGDDGAVIVWDARDGTAQRTLAAGAGVYRVAVDRARGRIAAAVVDPSVLVWDARTGERVASLGGHRGSANDAMFSAGQLLTTDEDGTLRRWDVDRAAVVGSAPTEGVAFSMTAGHGFVALAGETARLRVLRDAPDGWLARLAGHRARVRQVAFDAAGATLYTASNDGTARAWDAATGAHRFTVGVSDPSPDLPAPSSDAPPPPNPHGMRAIAVTPDERSLVTTAEDGTVGVWDARSGAALGRLDGHRGRVRDVTLTTDGAAAVTAGEDGSARVWDLGTRSERRRVDLGAPLLSARLTPDGRRIVVLAEDQTLSFWDAATGARVDRGGLAPTRIVGLPFTASGQLVSPQADAVRLIDPATGAEARAIGVGMVSSVDVSPDGRSLLFGGAGGEAYLVAEPSGARIRSWRAHEGVVTASRFRPDGALLATIGTDSVVRVWETASARLLASSPRFPGMTLQLRWSADGRRLGVAGVSAEAWVWQVAPADGDAATYARRARCVSPWRLDGTALVAAPADPAACGP